MAHHHVRTGPHFPVILLERWGRVKNRSRMTETLLASAGSGDPAPLEKWGKVQVQQAEHSLLPACEGDRVKPLPGNGSGPSRPPVLPSSADAHPFISSKGTTSPHPPALSVVQSHHQPPTILVIYLVSYYVSGLSSISLKNTTFKREKIFIGPSHLAHTQINCTFLRALSLYF